MSLNHPRLGDLDVDEFYQEPQIIFSEENQDIIVSRTKELSDFLVSGHTLFLSGDDQSGKSTTLMFIQSTLVKEGIPSVLINGDEIKRGEPETIIRKAANYQLGLTDCKLDEIIVIIDDWDECSMPERRQNKFVSEVDKLCMSALYSIYNRASAVSFAPSIQSPLLVFSLEQLPIDKIYSLVEAWVEQGEDANTIKASKATTRLYQQVYKMLNGGAVPSYPPVLIMLLRTMDAGSGLDISMTSNAACYDSLIALKARDHELPTNQIDGAKNFLGFLAFHSFDGEHFVPLSEEDFLERCRAFKNHFFFDPLLINDFLFESKILIQKDDGVLFQDKFLAYFFVGRHMATTLKQFDRENYDKLVKLCIEKVRYRAGANILIYCIYFSDDVEILDELLVQLNEKFEKSERWQLTNDDFISLPLEKSLLEGLSFSDDVRKERLKTISSEVTSASNIDADFAANLVGEYGSSLSSPLSKDDTADGTFLGELNSLFRLQSIIGTALNTRRGTFPGDVITRCVDAVVKSTGRFCNVNLAIAKSITDDLNVAVDLAKAEFPHDEYDFLEKGSPQLERQIDIFTAESVSSMVKMYGEWTILTSHCGTGRILSHDSSLMGLEVLRDKCDDENTVNYESVYAVAQLYNNNKIDQRFLKSFLKKHDETTLAYNVMGLAIYIYSRFMPIKAENKHWISSKFNISMKAIQRRQRKFLPKHSKTE